MLLRKRPPAGLLGGMLEVPSTDWAETLPEAREALRAAPVRGDWWAVPGTVTHTFTHFRLETMVLPHAGARRGGADLLGRSRPLQLGLAPRSATARRCRP